MFSVSEEWTSGRGALRALELKKCCMYFSYTNKGAVLGTEMFSNPKQMQKKKVRFLGGRSPFAKDTFDNS